MSCATLLLRDARSHQAIHGGAGVGGRNRRGKGSKGEGKGIQAGEEGKEAGVYV